MLQTERLTLRRGGEGDRADLLALNADAEVMRFVGGLGLAPGSPEAIKAADWAIGQLQRPDGLGIWILEWLDRAEFLGWAGLFDLPSEVGYRLKQAAWGQGIATEATKCLLKYGFETHGMKQIAAVTDPGHSASQHVLRKAGLTYCDQRHFDGKLVDYFEISGPRL